VAPALSFAHASGLHAVVRALAELHHETLRTAAEESGVRMSVANIVAAGVDATSVDQAEAVVTAIGERHPARAIVVLADPERDPLIEADLSLRWQPGTSNVCTELIRLTVNGQPALHLASIVTPLLVPDIPLHLWLTGAPRLAQAFNPDTVAMCDRIVLDSGRYPQPGVTLAQLATELDRHGSALALGDIAWVRTQPWRELSAQAFESAQTRPWLEHLEAVEIETAGTTPSAQGWLVAGWLAHCLRWDAQRKRAISCRARPRDGVETNDLAGVHYHSRVSGQRVSISLDRTGRTLRTDIGGEGGEVTSRSVVLPEMNDVSLIGGLFSDTAADPVYAEAVTIAASLAAAAA
jgi:glucose-6-phosphate dehydrogenase assembly protein OpcA